MISLLPLLLLAAQDPVPPVAAEPTGLRLELPPCAVADVLADPATPARVAEHRAALEALGDRAPSPWLGLPSWEGPEGMRAWDDAPPRYHAAAWDLWRRRLVGDDDLGRPPAYHLAQIARAQGRHADVWTHLAALDAGNLQDALDVLLLGLDPGEMPPSPLVVPLLPPIPEYDPETWQGLPPLREYVARGLRLGDTVLDLTVSVPREGVEVKLQHVSGPALDLRLKVPVPPRYERSIEYLDWDRLDELPDSHALTLAPGEEERVIWVRCLPQAAPWPRLPAGAGFPADRELVVRTTANDPALAQLRAFAEALDEVLPNAVRLDTDAAPLGRDLVLDLSPGPRRLDKLRAILGQVERHLLTQASR